MAFTHVENQRRISPQASPPAGPNPVRARDWVMNVPVNWQSDSRPQTGFVDRRLLWEGLADSVHRRNSRTRNGDLLRLIESAKKAGAPSLRAIAANLNGQDVAAPNGGSWHPNSLRRVLQHESHSREHARVSPEHFMPSGAMPSRVSTDSTSWVKLWKRDGCERVRPLLSPKSGHTNPLHKRTKLCSLRSSPRRIRSRMTAPGPQWPLSSFLGSQQTKSRVGGPVSTPRPGVCLEVGWPVRKKDCLADCHFSVRDTPC